MDLNLSEKVVLISGGASGIGKASVELFAAEGARVVVADKNAQAGMALQNSAKAGSIHFLEADLEREDECKRAVETALARFGGIDVLVNNAGGNDHITLEHTPSEFLQSVGRNLFHVFALTHFALPALKTSRGVILNVSSKVSVTGQGKTSGYAAAKGAINALTREWALALAPDRIRVNCVFPAECDTPRYQRWFDSQPDPTAARRNVEELIPLGRRLTTPQEISAMLVFLASPLSSHTTGQLIFVDGGYTHLDRASVGKGPS